MKRIIVFLTLFFCFSSQITAQNSTAKYFNKFSSDRVTFPVDGAIFQMDNTGKHNLKIVGQSLVSSGALAFTIWKKNGNGDNDWTIVSGYNNITIPTYNYTTVSGETGRLFHHTVGGLEKGWYKLKVHKYLKPIFLSSIFQHLTKHEVQFGIGDVYYVAGQSNASGWYWSSNTSFDNAISTTGEVEKSSPMVQTLSFEEDSDLGQSLRRGIPYQGGDHEFVPIVNKAIPGDYSQIENERINIYPNGYNSWAYGPLGYKIASQNGSNHKFSGTPTLWFNCATGGTSVNQGMGYPNWMQNPYSNNSLIGKLNYTLVNFAGPFGAKAVLWHQGEYDTSIYLNSPATQSSFHTNYSSKLSQIIQLTRDFVDINGVQSANLNWFVSKVSFTPFANIGPVSHASWSPLIGSGYIGGSGHLAWKSSSLKDIGQNPSLLLKPGTSTAHPNVFQGPNSDTLTGYLSGSSGPLFRANRYLIHFSGKEGLNALADHWYEELYNGSNNSKASESVPAAEVIALESVTKSGNTYKLKAPPFDGAKYFWVKNNDVPVNDILGGSSIREGSFDSPAPGDYLVGYVFKNGRLHPIQPYLVPGGDQTTKKIRIQNQNLTIPSSGGQVGTAVVGVLCDWEVVNSPNYSTVAYNEATGVLTFTASANSTGSTKSENITLREIGGSYTEIISISQPPNTSVSPIPLPSLMPTNSSSEWSGYGSAKFNGKTVDNNTMQVSGIQYTQGIGTHANSRIMYNLGGSYTTFTGLVGRDDEADNDWDGGKVTFSIKTDGSTVWTSSVHGNTTGAQSFSIPVSGKSTLELIVDKHNDENYSDHANWMNVNLTGSGGGCTNAAPTSVSASPSSFSSGGGSSTLTASCAAGATVVWSGSIGSGSPKTVTTTTTTTYTAKCVSASCSDSPTVSVTVTVDSSTPPTGCSAISNNLVMGTWTVTGHQLVAKQFHGQWWLVQRINTSPETFLVRGSSMLARSDVSTSYSGLVNCFAWKYSNFDGLQTPSSSEFATPSGYTLAYESDGTPYYTASGTPPSGCTNAYLTNSWTYASVAGGTSASPVIGIAIGGGNMAMGSVNYTSSYPGTGIGTHATSEIVYDLGAGHSYQYFKSTVGKDNGSNCSNYDRLKFKVINNATGTLLGESSIVGNPDFGLPRTEDMSVAITGVRYLKLVVEDGGDGIYCDHANWARARLTCTSSGRVSARDSLAPFFTIYPNVNNGEFTVEVDLEVDGDYTVDLINSSGAIYKQEKHKGKKGQNLVKIKAENVQSGLYLLRVTTKDRLETKTIVIEK